MALLESLFYNILIQDLLSSTCLIVTDILLSVISKSGPSLWPPQICNRDISTATYIHILICGGLIAARLKKISPTGNWKYLLLLKSNSIMCCSGGHIKFGLSIHNRHYTMIYPQICLRQVLKQLHIYSVLSYLQKRNPKSSFIWHHS